MLTDMRDIKKVLVNVYVLLLVSFLKITAGSSYYSSVIHTERKPTVDIPVISEQQNCERQILKPIFSTSINKASNSKFRTTVNLFLTVEGEGGLRSLQCW